MKNIFITQVEIAKALNVSQSTVSKYKNKRLKLDFEQGQILKEAFSWTDEDIKSFLNSNNNKEKSNTKTPQGRDGSKIKAR